MSAIDSKTESTENARQTDPSREVASSPSNEPQISIFTSVEKWSIVGMSAMAGLFR